jgi:hypothetical protein
MASYCRHKAVNILWQQWLNSGVNLGVEATADDVAASYEAIVDMAEVKTRGMLQLS